MNEGLARFPGECKDQSSKIKDQVLTTERIQTRTACLSLPLQAAQSSWRSCRVQLRVASSCVRIRDLWWSAAIPIFAAQTLPLKSTCREGQSSALHTRQRVGENAYLAGRAAHLSPHRP